MSRKSPDGPRPVNEKEPTDMTSAETREWILRAQAGSLDAYAALRGRYAPLIRSSIARLSLSGLSKQDRADLSDEAERIFLNAVSSFDTAQDEVSFGLYARVCLHNGLVSALRHITSRNKLVVVPMPAEEVPDDEDPAASVEAEESFDRLCGLVRETLSEFENQVWWAYVSGSSVSEIAARLGHDEKSVHNAVYRIRRKLRERLGGQ